MVLVFKDFCVCQASRLTSKDKLSQASDLQPTLRKARRPSCIAKVAKSAWVAGISFFLLFSAATTLAKPKDAPISPSLGRDIEIQLVRGGSADLVLTGIAMPRDTVQFEVMKPPRHGSLGQPRRINKDKVAFLYRHDGKKGEEQDSVDFRLKTGPEKAWGRIKAKIFISEPKSHLEFEPEALDFGAVPIGESKALALRLRNSGGGIIRGAAEISPLWSLEGGPTFSLAEGDSRTFLVTFAPIAPEAQNGRIVFKTGQRQEPFVLLRGEGVYRFKVAERVAIDENSKTAFLDILNLDSKDLVLHVGAPPPLVCESKIIVPASALAQLKLAVNDGVYTQKFVDLGIADGPVICSVRVDLPPSPVRLEWESMPVYDVGLVPWRNVPERSLKLKNAGASKATVRLVVGEGGLRLPPSQAESFEIPAGETAEVKVIWSLPEVIGEARAKIAAMQGDFSTELGLVAQVLPASAVTIPGVNEKKLDPVPTPSPDTKPFRVLSKSEETEYQLRMPSDIRYRLVAQDGAAIAIVSWNYRGPKPVKFQLERKVALRSSLDPGKVFEKRLEVPDQLPVAPTSEKWIRIGDSQAAIECVDGTAWQGHVPDLTSGFHAIRLVLLASEGKRVDIKEFPVEVGVLPRPAWMNWMMAGLFLLALYILRLRIVKYFGGGGDDFS